MLPLVARIPVIDKAVRDYVEAQDAHFDSIREEGGLVPIQYRDSHMLDQFAELIMYEELTWSHPDKMSIVEYPIMSDWQAKERRDKTSFPPANRSLRSEEHTSELQSRGHLVCRLLP